MRYDTPSRTARIRALKWVILILKITIFSEKCSRRKYFEIPQDPSKMPANLSGQFSLSRQIFLHRAAATLKGLGEFQNKKF